MQANFRPVARDDYEQWLALWNGYNEFYGRSGPTALSSSITATTWERFFDPYEPMHALVAEINGRLVGLAHFLLHRSTTAIAPSCYLQDLFTAEAVRRSGVGRALIQSVYHWAETNGCARVYWQTHETNTVARRLYDTVAQRSGFIVYRKLLKAP
jgi:GNAT superfamily N-acetyltransferase